MVKNSEIVNLLVSDLQRHPLKWSSNSPESLLFFSRYVEPASSGSGDLLGGAADEAV